jgi:hypothetical protein
VCSVLGFGDRVLVATIEPLFTARLVDDEGNFTDSHAF